MTILPNISFGLGCMGMSQWYGPTDEVESIATIRKHSIRGIPISIALRPTGLSPTRYLLVRLYASVVMMPLLQPSSGFP